jgi:hypothetical protein
MDTKENEMLMKRKFSVVAKMTWVSDVAHGPLVCIRLSNGSVLQKRFRADPSFRRGFVPKQ